jgi:hypothetical protein
MSLPLLLSSPTIRREPLAKRTLPVVSEARLTLALRAEGDPPADRLIPV